MLYLSNTLCSGPRPFGYAQALVTCKPQDSQLNTSPLSGRLLDNPPPPAPVGEQRMRCYPLREVTGGLKKQLFSVDIYVFFVASSVDSLKYAVADFPHMKRFNIQSKNTEPALR